MGSGARGEGEDARGGGGDGCVSVSSDEETESADRGGRVGDPSRGPAVFSRRWPSRAGEGSDATRRAIARSRAIEGNGAESGTSAGSEEIGRAPRRRSVDRRPFSPRGPEMSPSKRVGDAARSIAEIRTFVFFDAV